MSKKLRNIKNENKILIMLAFFSISIGLWGNFRQLWLQDNGLQVKEISNILSLATLICAFIILGIAKKIRLSKIKEIITFSIIFKCLNLFILFICNNTGLINLIKTLFIFDITLENVIVMSIYPLIVTIKKEDNLYSKRKLVEYLFKDVGILIGGIFIGRIMFGVAINYNVCLLISILFLILAFLIISNIKNTKAVEDKKDNITVRAILKDKLTLVYLIDYLIGQTAFNTMFGLKMLIFTNLLDFSANSATNYFLITGLIADFIGIIVLKYLTPKNDYLSITIKFVIRFFGYVIAFLSNNVIVFLIAITWSIFISTAYENKTDAPYVNNVANEHQLLFTDIRLFIKMIGETIGVFFAGRMYNLGLRYIFGLSALVMIGQILLAYVLIYMRQKREKTKNLNFT